MKHILVKQHDENDCGIACLEMLSQFYGSKIKYREIRELIQGGYEGISIEELIQGAKKIGFIAKAYKGNLKELQKDLKQKKIRLPFIAHTINRENLGHYVVVYNISKKGVVIGNPNGNLEKKTLKAFDQMWTGFMINLNPTDKIKGGKRDYIKKNIFFYIKKNKVLTVAILLISGIAMFCDFFCSQIISCIVDYLNSGNINEKNLINQSFLNQIWQTFSLGDLSVQRIRICCIWVVVFGVFEMLIMFLTRYLKSILDKRIDQQIMSAYYVKLLYVPIGFYEKIMAGDIMSRFYDITAIKNMIITLSLELSVSIITFLWSGIFLAFVSKILFAVIILIAFLYLLIVILYKKGLSKSARESFQNEAELISCIKETIDGMEVIKYNTCESFLNKKFQQILGVFLNSVQKNSLLGYSQESVNIWITFMGNVLVLGIGIYLCICGHITIGVLVSFMYIMCFFLNPVQKLADFQSVYENGKMALDRLNDIMGIQKECDGYMNFPVFDVLKYKNVEFKYASSEFGLKNINLRISKGHNVAIIGKSGCGKTSLVKLLVGGLVQQGSIVVGKTNLADIKLREIRHNIVYLPQKSFVFSGTIRDNIILGRDDIEEERLNKVCEICFGRGVNKSSKMGLNMLIAENGVNLSGGQIQRIALARAIINKPSILVLDEATSNIDLYGEESIMKKIRLFLPETTIIVITHRLDHMEKYDKILFMENGEIVMQGTHCELMKKSKSYSSFVRKGELK